MIDEKKVYFVNKRFFVGLILTVFVVALIVVFGRPNSIAKSCTEIGRVDIPKGDSLYRTDLDKNSDNLACNK